MTTAVYIYIAYTIISIAMMIRRDCAILDSFCRSSIGRLIFSGNLPSSNYGKRAQCRTRRSRK